MASTRIVKTGIYDDEFIFDLPASAKFLYLFLITNKNTEISGYYSMTLNEMEFYTKIKKDDLKKLLAMLEPKIYYTDNWVIIAKYDKHQNFANNSTVQRRIETYKMRVPEHILNYKKDKSEIINHKSEAMDSLSIDYPKNAKTSQEKQIFGEFKQVRLTVDEHVQLVDKLGKTQADEMIEQLDQYIASKGKKYKSHYATILTWARKNGVTNSPTKTKYDL